MSEDVNPLPVDPRPDAGPADAGGDAAPPPDAGGPKRTVLQRNPFGNVTRPENLLWDGDFEWSSPFSDEYGWLAGPPYSYDFTGTRVGPMCRSGIKCAPVKKKKGIIGIGVSPQGSKVRATFWAHLAEGTCDQVSALVSAVFDDGEADAPVKPVSTTPDDSGWCFFDTTVGARNHKPFLFIVNKTNDEIIVDDAALERAPDAMKLTVAIGPLEPELVAEVKAAREDLLRLRGPHDAPPNEAKKAFEKWNRR